MTYNKKIEPDEAERLVANAFLELVAEGDDPKRDDIEWLATRSGVMAGTAFDMVKEWGVTESSGGLDWRPDVLRRVQAVAAAQVIRRSPATTNNSFNISGGTVQAAVGDISGTQNVTVTYGDVLTSLSSQIERSALPAEQKSSAMKALTKVVEIVGPTLLKAGVELASMGVFPT